IGRDLTHHGVSIVNVGTTGLGRFARIYQRADPEADGQIEVPVACISDLDVMPDCAPEMIGKVKDGENRPELADRKWRVVSDFDDATLMERREALRQRASGQRVETFVSDQWTLEYDLAHCGLAREMWLAVQLASQDERISQGRVSAFAVTRKALRSWAAFEAEELTTEEQASRIYAPLAKGNVSKPITVQYLARILELSGSHKRTTDEWRAAFPQYLVSAIDYVTSLSDGPEPEEEQADA
ncbi:MAG: ATP-dependent nuclease, partial [Hyphomicrobiaceae bacterium]